MSNRLCYLCIKLENMREASLVLMTYYQARKCAAAKDMPIFTEVDDFSGIWEGMGVSKEDVDLFPDTHAPRGYLWVIFTKGDFDYFTEVLNKCEL